MNTLARFAVARPWAILALWLLSILGAQVGAAVLGSDYRNDVTLEGTDSQAAVDLLDQRFPAAAGDADSIVWQVESGSPIEGAPAQQVQALLAQVADVESVTSIQGPLAPQAEGMPSGGSEAASLQVSDDGTIAYATVQYDRIAAELPREELESIADLVAEADDAGGEQLSVAIAGQGMALLSAPEVGLVEVIGLLFAAAVLLLAFGSLVAMSLPIISALAALSVALGLLGMLSNTFTVSDVAPVLGVLLGLGVGIDYALFIVNRFRGQLAGGRSVDEAVVAATTTSGRAVVFAGLTVIIALAGVLVPGISLLVGLAVGAGIAVLLSMLAAITLLPALLRLLGHRVLSAKVRSALGEGEVTQEHASRGFAGWARLVRTRPVVLGLAGLIALGTIAIPTLDLRLGTADQGNDPSGTTTRVAYDLLAEGFGPGFNGPLVVVADLSADPIDVPEGGAPPAEGEPAAAPPVPAQLQNLVADLSSDPGVTSVVGPAPNEDGTAAVLQVVPDTSPQDERTGELLDRIRDEYAVSAAEQDVTVNVGGAVATFADFATEIADVLPEFFALVIGLSFLLLVVAFRSLLVPLVGAVMNLVSAAAAFGVIVAVFQWGWAADLVGVGAGGPIEPFIPIVLFALLFGLSMDYQVFLVSRIAEEWQHRQDNHEAVRVGHAEVGKVIVAAASIMVFVFGGFIFGDARTVKLIGLGLAAAVLLDALVIRMLVVPALMHLLGRANWWLPGWLDRILPMLAIEGQPSGRPGGRHTAGTTNLQLRTLPSPPPPSDTNGAHQAEGGWSAGFTDGHRAGMQAQYDRGFREGFAEAVRTDQPQRDQAGHDDPLREAPDPDAVKEPEPADRPS